MFCVYGSIAIVLFVCENNRSYAKCAANPNEHERTKDHMNGNDYCRWRPLPSSQASLTDQLIANIRWSISTGELKKGEKLPALRYLSDLLDLSLNTVRIAYKALEKEQLVSCRPYHGTVVMHPQIEQQSSLGGEEQAVHLFEQVINRIINNGITVQRTKELFDAAVERVINQSTVKLLVVECSAYECEMLSQQLSNELGISADYILNSELEKALKNQSIVPSDYLNVTTYFHYSEVMRILKDYKVPLLGLVVDMSILANERIMSLAPGAKIGIISKQMYAVQFYDELIRKIRADVQVTFAYLENSEAMHAIANESEIVLCLPPIYREASEKLGKNIDVLPLETRVNYQSIEMIRQVIANY